MIKCFDLVETFNSEIKVHNRPVGLFVDTPKYFFILYETFGTQKNIVLKSIFFLSKILSKAQKNVLAR